MSRSMRWMTTGIVAIAVASGGCRGDEAMDRIAKALTRCDDTAACARAVSDLRTLDRERRDSAAGIENRLKALRVSLAALAAFPEPDRVFLEGAGLAPDRAAALLDEEARAIETLGARGTGAADARAVLGVIREPSCERLQALEAVEKEGGRFADVAYVARLGVLAQLVGSVEAARVQAYSEVARTLLGCRLPADIGDAEILVEARQRLSDLLESCPKGAGATASVRASCEKAGEILQVSMPLPLPGIASGELAGAQLPAGRGTGIAFSPPWVLALSAGRLQILDQPSLAPGAKGVPDVQPTVLFDLRRSHRLDDVRTAVYMAWKDRPPVEIRGRKLFPLAVDRSASYSDLMELLEAILSESDAVPAMALLPSGARSPSFLPLNYRVSVRPLMDPWGNREAFGTEVPALDLFLSPFNLTVRAPGIEKAAEVLPPLDSPAPRRPDLRSAYQVVLEAVGRGKERSARLTASATVPVGLLAGVLETIAARVDPAALASPGAFATATPLHRRDGSPDPLVPLVVLRSSDMPPE